MLTPFLLSIAVAQCPSLTATQEAVLLPSPTKTAFGKNVAISGERIVVGGGSNNITSASSTVAVFERSGTSWAKVGQGNTCLDVDIDGDRAIAGRPWLNAQIDVLEPGGPGWSTVQQVNFNGCPHDDFGTGVALQGDVLAGGAPETIPWFGTVVIYDRVGTSWTERYWMNVGNCVGMTVDMDGPWVVAGGIDHAEVFELQPATWTSRPIVSAGVTPGEGYGTDVAVSGDLLAVGAPGAGKGRVYVYHEIGGYWSLGPAVQAGNTQAGDDFGAALALDGERLLVGASGKGSAYLFERVGTGWVELGEFKNSGPGAALFGRAVDLDGDLAVVGASGSAYAFHLATALPPTAYCTAGTTASGCNAFLGAAGTPSASSPSGFVVTVDDVEGQKDGVLYFSTAGTQANPWGNGTSRQCVVPPVVRTGVQNGVGTVDTCEGAFALDFNTWMATHPAKAPGAGDRISMQAWFRDPKNTSNQSTSLSDALAFTICP